MFHINARSRRAGRSVLVVAALGLALSVVPSAAWAGTGSAPGQNGSAGRPADGSVGKADDKAPPGQSVDGVLDGSDLNAGYECDTNHGVGQGNPAHTGCVFA
jgi:hypothetical protein